MTLETLMKELAQEMELDESLAKASAGTFTIPLEEDLKIKLNTISEGFLLTSQIIACPTTNREAFFTRMLLANLFGQGTRGSVLGTSEEGNLLTLSRIVDYNVDYKSFREIIEDFINTVDFWREEVLNHK